MAREMEELPSPLVEEAEVAAFVVRYQAGEADALAALHARMERAIRSVLRGYRASSLPSSLAPQDLQQQSWIVLGELARRWRPGGSFVGYFFHSFPRMIARYVYVHRRASGPAHEDDQVFALAESPAPYEVEPPPTLKALLHLTEGLTHLSAVERAVFILHTLEGQDFAAIGDRLGLSKASAHRAHLRARKRLVGQLTPAPIQTTDGAVERVVRALHALAGPGGGVVGRRRVLERGGIRRPEYELVLSLLERCGAVTGRDARHAGRLTGRTPEATLRMVGVMTLG